ncbi:phage protease [Neptunicella sp. SCSIO 80796]|uniref:phage protease n=1 Tax=Neptunicella plasticusilytica TaxID=3117012 RepID=UPI003A4E4BC1
MPAAALSFAALSNQSEQPLGIAACSFEIQLDQPWQQILPGTDFSAYDGRPIEIPGNKWRINDVSGALLAAKLNARADAGQRLLFDYDHQTLLSKENGQKAPASAWGKKFEWRKGHGLFAQLKFTPAARQHIKDEEYKFYSPVVMYNKTTGEVLDLHSAALTNDPGIKGMAEAAALHNQFTNQPPENTPMNPIMLALLNALGLSVDDPKQDLEPAALKALLISDEAKAGLAALTAKVEEHGTQTTEIAALKAQVGSDGNAEPDPAKFVPMETYSAVIAEMATLKANHDTITVAQLIEQAQDDGKFIAAAEIPFLTKMGNSDFAALKANLDGRASIAALSGQKQTTEQKPDAKDKTGVAALTADQKLIATQMGISHEDYAKTLATEQQAQA